MADVVNNVQAEGLEVEGIFNRYSLLNYYNYNSYTQSRHYSLGNNFYCCYISS